MKKTKGVFRRLACLAAALLLVLGCLSATAASGIPYKGTVTLYGTPAEAIKSGPVYGSKVSIDLGTRYGQSWNNESFTIPQVSEYFTLNEGWAIDYVNVAANSSGKRQPGSTILLSMSGGSLVYYFKKVNQSWPISIEYVEKGNPSNVLATDTYSGFGLVGNKAVVSPKTSKIPAGWQLDPASQSATVTYGTTKKVTFTLSKVPEPTPTPTPTPEQPTPTPEQPTPTPEQPAPTDIPPQVLIPTPTVTPEETISPEPEEIEDEDIPLVEGEEEEPPEDDGAGEEIEDEEIPTTNVPKTGDSAQFALAMLLALVGMAGAVIALRRAAKNR